MKKFFTILALSFLPLLASASTVSLSPASIAVTEGQSVTVNLVVDPQGTAYTAKLALSFPAELVSVSSFTQASGWMPLSQPGYDLIDNSGGSLIKTAGATGGFSAPKVFGTVTFTAKSSGTAQIAVTGATQILDASNQNTFTGGGQAHVTISAPQDAPIVVPASPQTVSPKPKTSPARNLLENDNTVSSPVVAVAASSDVVATTLEEKNLELTAQMSLAGRDLDIPFNIIIPVLTFLAGFALGRKTR